MEVLVGPSLSQVAQPHSQLSVSPDTEGVYSRAHGGQARVILCIRAWALESGCLTCLFYGQQDTPTVWSGMGVPAAMDPDFMHRFLYGDSI